MLIALVSLLVAQASSSPPSPVSSSTVGVYVNQLASIDLKANQFTVDFWVWFRSTGRAALPVDSFEIIDGKINSKTNIIKKKMPNGEDYGAARVNATIHQQWDLRRYPLDDHDLQIIIEDSEMDATRAVFVADAKGQGIDPRVSVSGWDVGRTLGHQVISHLYESNYGDLSISETAATHFSRYAVTLEAKRSNVGRFFKVLFALLISVLVSWCAFFIRPKDASPRVSVSVGALFAGAAGMIAINTQLPELSYSTLTDKTIFLCLGMILLSLIGTVASLTFNYQGNEAGWRRVDRIGGILFPVLFVVMLLVIVL